MGNSRKEELFETLERDHRKVYSWRTQLSQLKPDTQSRQKYEKNGISH